MNKGERVKNKIELISFGSDGCNVLFQDTKKVEVRTIKDMKKTFRGRTFEDCEGTDFWEITEEEEKTIIENTTLDEVGEL